MSSIRCPECNFTDWANAIACKRCGYPFQAVEDVAAQTETGQNQFSEQNFDDLHRTNPEGRKDFHAPNQEPQADWSNSHQSEQNYRQTGYQSNYQPNHSQNYQAGYRQTYQPNYAASKQKSGMAIASMVFGLIGCFLTAPVGLILGIVSLKRANNRPLEYGGRAFAITGIVLNSIGFLTIPIIAAIAIPNLLAARRAANEGSAISSLRILSSAEATYMETENKNRCADLPTLSSKGLIDPALAKGQKNGYRYMIINLPTAAGGCEMTATPMSASHGTRSFYFSTEDGLIRAAAKNGLFADSSDAPLNQSYSTHYNDSR
jgi:hypothetical protein